MPPFQPSYPLLDDEEDEEVLTTVTSREDQLMYTGPIPERSSLPQSTRRKHPLAGRTNGVRSTSRQAYASIQDKLGPKQLEMYRFIKDKCTRPINDRELVGGLGWPISSVTARRNELVEKSKVEEAFRDVDPKTGKRAIYWKAVA